MADDDKHDSETDTSSEYEESDFEEEEIEELDDEVEETEEGLVDDDPTDVGDADHGVMEDEYDEHEAADSFTEVTHKSWGERLGEQAGLSIAGLVLFLAAFPLLFWNEGQAVDRAQALDEGRGAVVSVKSDSVAAENEGKLVHLIGKAKTEELLSDADFGIETNAIKLRRISEMFQWRETKVERTEKTSGGGEKTITTYKYKGVWSEDYIDSSAFRKSKRYENPSAFSFPSQQVEASSVTVGAFQVPPSLVNRIGNFTALKMSSEGSPSELAGKAAHYRNGSLYLGTNPSKPKIGDLKVRFEIVPTNVEVSIVSRQLGNTLKPYRTKTGEIELLQLGAVGSELMFSDAEDSSAMFTWFLRIAGTALMAIGLGMLFQILSTVIDRVPLIGIHVGSVVSLGTSVAAVLIALPLALLTIAIAWLYVRPFLSLGLVALAVASFVGYRKFRRS
tara:strand:- start:108 stop:1451 length:1344 start_codon:yes stop_codon:yes gene_type:complete